MFSKSSGEDLIYTLLQKKGLTVNPSISQALVIGSVKSFKSLLSNTVYDNKRTR